METGAVVGAGDDSGVGTGTVGGVGGVGGAGTGGGVGACGGIIDSFWFLYIVQICLYSNITVYRNHSYVFTNSIKAMTQA